MPQDSCAFLNSVLQKFPTVRQLCERRRADSISNGDSLTVAQESIADAINRILDGADGSDRAKVEIAVRHLAIAHMFAQAMKKQ